MQLITLTIFVNFIVEVEQRIRIICICINCIWLKVFVFWVDIFVKFVIVHRLLDTC